MVKAKSNTDPKGRQFISRMRKLPVLDAPIHKSPNGAKEAFRRTTNLNKQTQSNPNFVAYSNFWKRIAIFKPATVEGAFAAFTLVLVRHLTPVSVRHQS